MGAFAVAEDIVNRALQRVGSQRIASLTTDTSKRAQEASFLYAKNRRAEMRRNTWRFSIRRAMLRAVGGVVPAWATNTVYVSGSLVSYNNLNWISQANGNVNNTPSLNTGYWLPFYGNTSQQVVFSAWSNGTTYALGVIVVGSDNQLYLSMKAANTANNPTTDNGSNWTLYFGSSVANAFDPTQSYSVGELVVDQYQNVWYSTANNNTTPTPSIFPGNPMGLLLGLTYTYAQGTTTNSPDWTYCSGTPTPLVIQWPAGTGPATNLSTRNVFVLPYGFLRIAPQDPRQGDYSVLGYPSNLTKPDWELEGGLLTSGDTGPIMLRFAADVTQVSLMDDLFCEGLAARIALELCETLTQSGAKFQMIGTEYKQFMSDARSVNGIEQGSTSFPLDDFIAVRV